MKRLGRNRLLQLEAAQVRGHHGQQVRGLCRALRATAMMQPWRHCCACMGHPEVPARPICRHLRPQPLRPHPLPLRSRRRAELDGSRLQTRQRRGEEATRAATSTRCMTSTTSVTETSWDASKHPHGTPQEKHFSPSPIGVLQLGLQCRGERRLD